MKFKIFLFLVWLICSVGLISATDYYVSTVGNDSKNGLSIATSWKTITRSVNASGIDAGDILNIQSGIYYESSISPFNNGTSDKRIIIIGNGSVILDGLNSSNSIIEITTDFVTVDNITVFNATNGATSDANFTQFQNLTCYNMKTNGIILKSGSNYGIIQDSISYNNNLHNFGIYGNNAIGRRLTSYATVNQSAYNSPDYLFTSISTGTSVQNVTWENLTGYGIASHGITLDNTINSKIRNVNISHKNGEVPHFVYEIRTTSSDIILQNITSINTSSNSAIYNKGIYIFGTAKNITVDGGYIHGFRDAVDTSATTNNITISHLIIDDNYEGMSIRSTNTTVKSNTINNVRTGIYFITATSDCIAKNNIITSSIYGLRDQSTNNSIMEYNSLWDNTNNYLNAYSSNDILADPLYYDTINFYLNSTYGTWNGTGWEIMSTHSPCIDTGNPSDDYSNEPSGNGGRINIGAYGNTIYASKSEEIVTSTMTIPANSWGMFNNWTSTMTFAGIAANESNDVCYTYYNITSGLWESYYVGYAWNADYQLFKNASVMGYFDAETSITSDIITPSSTELYTGWNMLGIQSSSNQTISGIIVDIGANCSDSWYFNSSTGGYSNTTTHSIQPNQGFLAYITQNMTWARSTM